jgi:hypothetical protein
MDKENMVHKDNGIIFSIKKEVNPVYARTWKNLEDIMLNGII